jgi:hypothetical protein
MAAKIKTSVVRTRAACPTGIVLSRSMPVRRSQRLVHARTGDGKVTREYREDDDELIEGPSETMTSSPGQEQRQGGAQYIDELPDLVCFVWYFFMVTLRIFCMRLVLIIYN